MATLVLPARSDLPFYDFGVDLEGSSFTFELRWNPRAGAWFLSVYDAAGDLLIAGRRVVLGVSLFGPNFDERLPPGFLCAIDTGTTGEDPGRDDLGGRVVLVYDESEA